MFAYIKKFWLAIVGGLSFGIALTILLDIPVVLFSVSLAIFVCVLQVFVEKLVSSGAADLISKVFRIFGAILVFVGLRSFVGYLIDNPAGNGVHEAIASSNGYLNLPFHSMPANLLFELLFLVPGWWIAYGVVQKNKGWRVVVGIFCTLAVIWVGWTMKQKTHAEAMKRQTQALISLSARSLNNKALINEAAAATSFGIAKEQVSVFYQWDAGATNMVMDTSITIRLKIGDRVLQLRPNDLPVIFEGQAFTQIVLANTNGSFVGGTKTWVEAWRFDWVNGKNTVTATMSSPVSSKPKFETLPPGIHLIRVAPREETNWKVIPKDLYWSLSARSNGGDWQLKPFNGHSVQYKNGQSQLTDITGLGNTIRITNDGDKELEFDLVVKR